MQMQYDIIKLDAWSIPFSKTKYKGREKTSNERKNWWKTNAVSANTNSREVFKIETQKIPLEANSCENYLP